MKKRILSFLLAAVLAVSLVPGTAFAAEIVASGKCGADGDNVTWTLDSEGTLTISGTGKMRDVASYVRSPWYSQRESIKNTVIEFGVTSIGSSAFDYCTSLSSVSIPNSVTSIGNSAFYCCTSLSSVLIPTSVTQIGNSAFYNCSGLSSVLIPDSVTTIGYHAFSKCNSLTVVLIPDSVTVIRESPFSNCSSLMSIEVDKNNLQYTTENGVLYTKDHSTLICYPAGKTGLYKIPESVNCIGSEAFSGGSGLTGVSIPDSVLSIGSRAFSGCGNLTSVTIPSSVTAIKIGTFKDCSKLANIEIPDSVTEIGWDAWDPSDGVFSGCSSLTNISIPNNVKHIGRHTFSGCNSLTNISIPNSVTYICDETFIRCTSLSSVSIPNSITSIGCYAFDNCNSLSDVYYSGSEEEWNKVDIGSYNAPLTKDTTTIHYNSSGPSNTRQETHILSSVLVNSGDGVAYAHFKDGTSYPLKDQDANLANLMYYKDQKVVCTIETVDGVDYLVSISPAITTTSKETKKLVSAALVIGTGDAAGQSATKLTFEDGMTFFAADTKQDYQSYEGKYLVCTVESTCESDKKITEVKPVKATVTAKAEAAPSVQYKSGLLPKFACEGNSLGNRTDCKIPVRITVKNSVNAPSSSLGLLKEDSSLTLSVDQITFDLPKQFCFGKKDAGRFEFDKPITLTPGESKTVEGYLIPSSSFQQKAAEQTYFVRAVINYEGHTTAADVFIPVVNVEEKARQENAANGTEVSNAASKAAEELEKMQTVITLPVELGVYLGKDAKKETEDALLAAIAAVTIPEETFKGKVNQKVIDKVFGAKVTFDATADSAEIKLPVSITQKKSGRSVTDELLFTIHLNDFNLEKKNIASWGTIDYSVLKGNAPVQFSRGAITKVKMNDFCSAVSDLAEAQIKRAYDTAWGGTIDEVQRLIFSDTINAILDARKTSVSDIVFKVITSPAKTGRISCPVDVFVYDEDHVLVGSNQGGTVESSSLDVELSVEGETKYFTLRDSEYQLELQATGSGTMDVEIMEYGSGGDLLRSVNHYDVPLQLDLVYDTVVTEAAFVDTYELLSETGEAIEPDEDDISGSDADVPAITGFHIAENKITLFLSGVPETGGTLVVAAYDDDGQMLRSTVQNVTMADEFSTVNADLTGASSARAFLLDAAGKPLTDAMDLDLPSAS